VDATGTRVATASGGADHRDANARLIAAAPELLEALELFANLDRTVNSDLWAIDAMYCERARAAIQKARA
jgi:ABC-type lipoprotein export system ATPase subunit